MKTEHVKFICPECKKEWFEDQDPNDEWFKLATRDTLYIKCAKKHIASIKKE